VKNQNSRELLMIQRKQFRAFDGDRIDASIWAYFSFKAARFLVVGAEIYRKDDFFHYPLPEWNEAKLKAGCEPIIYNCAGLPVASADLPKGAFVDLSECDLKSLFNMFHFDMEYASPAAETPNGVFIGYYIAHKVTRTRSFIYAKETG
jgi:hypothetical protein